MVASKPKPAGGKRALAKKALQLRISLLEIEPKIWRRFVVPADIPLGDLHDVLQAVKGWLDCHLHLFHFRSGDFGIPDPDFEDDTKDESTKKLHQLVEVGGEFGYAYDFGDDWQHIVVVEATVERQPPCPPLHRLDRGVPLRKVEALDELPLPPDPVRVRDQELQACRLPRVLRPVRPLEARRCLRGFVPRHARGLPHASDDVITDSQLS